MWLDLTKSNFKAAHTHTRAYTHTHTNVGINSTETKGKVKLATQMSHCTRVPSARGGMQCAGKVGPALRGELELCQAKTNSSSGKGSGSGSGSFNYGRQQLMPSFWPRVAAMAAAAAAAAAPTRN